MRPETEELGYGFSVWTIDRLRAHLAKETGIDVSESRFRDLVSSSDLILIMLLLASKSMTLMSSLLTRKCRPQM